MKVAFGLVLFAPLCAFACINDRDTLAFEIRNVDALHRITNEKDPSKKAAAIQELALRAIGGRFDRFPPLYYSMRIDRLKAQKSLTANEYDDLSVAYDRLGKVDEAIKVILASKAARTTWDDKYRFHANYGTFLVHRWIVRGHKASENKILHESIGEIKEALRINPDSHFGREWVQLHLETAWLTPNQMTTELGSTEARTVVGLSGIVMMGLGYELPDIYGLLENSYLVGWAAESNITAFASMRYQELIDSGSRPILSDIDHEDVSSQEVRRQYKSLRGDGHRVQEMRLAYMDQRLRQGRHPDTDTRFWAEWQEPAQPVLRKIPNPDIERMDRELAATVLVVLSVPVLAIIGSVVYFCRRRAAR